MTNKIIKFGGVEFKSNNVQKFSAHIVNIRYDSKYESYLASLSDEERENYPDYKVGLVLDNYSLMGFNSHKGVEVMDSHIIWLSEYELQYALYCNELVNKVFLEEYLVNKNLDFLKGCQITGALLRYEEGTVPTFPFSGKEGDAPLEHNLIKAYAEHIKFDMDSPCHRFEQRNAVLRYAELYPQFDIEDVVDSLEDIEAIKLSEKARESFLRKKKVEPNMAQMFKMMKMMMNK
uniref:Uncharacterized protein n=1 Tax=Geladintestivirus 1 TaxID=3233133 RepID=A0AAU8MLP3_9CAUD